MRALDITKHKTNLTNVLIGIYKNSYLAPVLGLKGGTAAMLFYQLPRFSVDLDFDLIGQDKGFVERMTGELADKYEIKEKSAKFSTLFWRLSYGVGLANIKVEVSTRNYSYNRYNSVPFYGVTVKVLDIRDMAAHKMVAVMERKSTANRDLFDIHYFLSSPVAGEINYEVIKGRTGKNPREFYKDLLDFVGRIKPGGVLEGLGEVLTQSQKDWAKVKLLEELKGLIQRQMELSGMVK